MAQPQILVFGHSTDVSTSINQTWLIWIFYSYIRVYEPIPKGHLSKLFLISNFRCCECHILSFGWFSGILILCDNNQNTLYFHLHRSCEQEQFLFTRRKKHQHIEFRSCGITQIKGYNIQIMSGRKLMLTRLISHHSHKWLSK